VTHLTGAERFLTTREDDCPTMPVGAERVLAAIFSVE
jgi:hypothetical protein